ncbi:MAG: aminopeptidase P N-terminal domain-containing protein [Gammaproteobacteria bacterium]|nr:aminopeptidase P N-terminal domain-containing protein [Gammaproteobacteria bacterium]
MLRNQPNETVAPSQDPAVFAQRRTKLIQEIGPHSLVIIPGASLQNRNRDNEYSFRQESSFYYLTGIEEDDAIAVFIPGRREGEYILFNKKPDPISEAFLGEFIGQENAVKIYGANESYPREDFDTQLPNLFDGITKIYYPIAQNKSLELDKKILKILGSQRDEFDYGVRESIKILDSNPIIHSMRSIKDPNELALIKHAIEISEQAHLKAMQICKPGINEMKLSRKIIDVFMDHGSQEVAYPNVVGAGANSCTLHYGKNASQVKEGDLVLIDAGVEYKNYSSDITRTFPANGKYSLEQRTIYDIVLKAQEAVIKLIKPGVTWKEMNTLAAKEITLGLINIGLLKGELDELVEKKAYRSFYMHGIGHALGLDVHDVGSHATPLEAGMTLTVEPGIYINDKHTDVDPRWHNIGIRIEDNVLVTPEGCEVLSKHLPKKAEEIEKVMTGFVPEEMIKIGYQNKIRLFNLPTTVNESTLNENTNRSIVSSGNRA